MPTDLTPILDRLTELDRRFDAYDKRFDEHDKRFDAHDRQFEAVIECLIGHDKRFDSLEETIVRFKDDILSVLDKQTVILLRLDQEVAALSHRVDRHDVQISALTKAVGLV